MKLSGKGALALLAALVVSGEEGASASGGGSESIMVCNVFAKFYYALYSHTYNILYLLCTPILILILSPT